MVQTGPEDDHGFALGLFGIAREFAGDRDDLVGGNAGDLFSPFRCERDVHIIGAGDPVAAQTAIKAIVGAEQVEHGGDHDLTVRRLDLFDRNVVGQNVGVLAAYEILGRLAAEIGEVDGNDIVVMLFEDQRG